jgi:hypothetical protein
MKIKLYVSFLCRKNLTREKKSCKIQPYEWWQCLDPDPCGSNNTSIVAHSGYVECGFESGSGSAPFSRLNIIKGIWIRTDLMRIQSQYLF